MKPFLAQIHTEFESKEALEKADDDRDLGCVIWAKSAEDCEGPLKELISRLRADKGSIISRATKLYLRTLSEIPKQTGVLWETRITTENRDISGPLYLSSCNCESTSWDGEDEVEVHPFMTF